MKQLFKIHSPLLAILFLVMSCQKSGTDPDPLPPVVATLSISSISPDYGKANIDITITGTGFSTTIAENLVTLGGKTAVVSSANATELKIKAPADATHGVIEVKVGTKSASSVQFTYEPEIASISASSGKAGDAIIITGKHFGTTAADFEVKFNGITAEITTATATTLSVKVPTGATSGAISVARKTRTAIAGPTFTIVAAPPAPTGIFAVTDGSITFGSVLVNGSQYGQVLCFTIDEANSILYAGTTTHIVKVDLASNSVSPILTNSTFLTGTGTKPSAMDVAPDGKLYLLTEYITAFGIPPTGGNIFYINTSSNTATLMGNKFVGVNVGGYTGQNIPFMVTADTEFLVMDGNTSTIAKYSSNLTVRTVAFTLPVLESFSHLIRMNSSTVRVVVNTLTGKSYYDLSTSTSAKTDLASAVYTDLVSIARGGGANYSLQSKVITDPANYLSPFQRSTYTIGKLNTAQTGFDKKASFTIEKSEGTAPNKQYAFIGLNGKTYFHADKNGNLYALLMPNYLGDAGVYKITIN